MEIGLVFERGVLHIWKQSYRKKTFQTFLRTILSEPDNLIAELLRLLNAKSRILNYLENQVSMGSIGII